jgi:hypothetical protein
MKAVEVITIITTSRITSTRSITKSTTRIITSRPLRRRGPRGRLSLRARRRVVSADVR